MNKIWSLLILLTSFQAIGQKSLTLQQMQEDFDQLAKQYKENHQGLYFYTDTTAANRKIDSLRATLTADLDSRTFFNKIAALVTLTNEGHTNLDYPKRQQKRFSKQQGFIPLGIFFCGENQDAIIKSVYSPTLQHLKGKKLRSVNGHPMEKFMQDILPYVATDGFNQTSAYEWVAWDFPFFYYQLFGLSTTFELELEDTAGQKSTQQVAALDYKSIKKQAGSSDFLLVNGIFKIQDFRIIHDSIAYFAISTFSGKSKVFDKLYRKVFTTIKSKGIQHLILDIQRHVGGSEGVENLLASYLYDAPFQKYKEVTAPYAAYQKFKNKKSAKLDNWRLENGIPVRGDYTLMSNYYSEHGFMEPPKELKYHGKVYVLTSGVTFSGGAELASLLKMRERAIFIGEEVGGAHEGNVSGSGSSIKLKHSKISASLPYVHFKMNVQPAIKGHGVMPDHYVPQSWKDLNEGVNSKLKYALDLISRKQ